jgi:hypothetical protein
LFVWFLKDFDLWLFSDQPIGEAFELVGDNMLVFYEGKPGKSVTFSLSLFTHKKFFNNNERL